MSASAPATPIQTIPSNAPTGTWRHPQFDQIQQRMQATRFDDRNIRTVLWNVLFLIITFLIPSVESLKALQYEPFHYFQCVSLICLKSSSRRAHEQHHTIHVVHSLRTSSDTCCRHLLRIVSSVETTERWLIRHPPYTFAKIFARTWAIHKASQSSHRQLRYSSSLCTIRYT